ncbi:MAG: pepsin/retropepsin-like aspartic protease family protein [Pseudomonadota bacterium]
MAAYRVDYNGWLTVKASVNGAGPYDFIVDTGATLTVVFKNLADAQALTPSDTPPRRVLGLSSAEKLPAVNIGEVSAAGQALPAHVGVVLPDWTPPRKTPQGILGLDFLENYTVIFDGEEQKMLLFDPTDPPRDRWRGWRRIKLTPENFGFTTSGALYTVNGRVGRVPINFVVDIGAAGTIINRNAFLRINQGPFIQFIEPSRLRSTIQNRVTDVFEEKDRVFAAVLPWITFGRHRWRQPRVLVYDAPVFEELKVNERPSGLLGADFLKDRSFAFDFKNERLYFEKDAR